MSAGELYEENGEADDDSFPLVSPSSGKMATRGGGNRPTSILPPNKNRATRRQSVAAIGQGAELTLASSSWGDRSPNRTTSLNTIGGANSNNNNNNRTGIAGAFGGMVALVNAMSSSQTINSVGAGSMTNSKTNLLVEAPGNIDANNPLYETLIKSLNRLRESVANQSLNKRRESAAKMNASSTASLLVGAAPHLIGATPQQLARQRIAVERAQNVAKKSVCFADMVQTSDGGEALMEGEDDDQLMSPDSEQLLSDEDETLDEEEKRKATLDRMKRRKEDALTSRMKKYGYDPLSPPVPKTWAEWSIQRRDYQAALSEILQSQKAPQLSPAALKGRKDSVAFVKDDLVDIHLNKKHGKNINRSASLWNELPMPSSPHQDGNSFLAKFEKGEKGDKQKEPKKPAKKPTGKGAVRNRLHQAQLSDADLEILKAYYYHPLFSGARAFSFLCNLMAMGLIVLAVVYPVWIKIPHKVEPFGPEYVYQLTMFQNCTVLLSATGHSFFSDLREFASDLREAVDHRSVAVLTHNKQGSLTLKQQLSASKQQPDKENEDAIGTLSTTATLEPSPFGSAAPFALSPAENAPYVESTLVPANDLGFVNGQLVVGNHTFEGECEAYSLGTWQTFLIGVMAFAVLFSMFAFVIAMCGVCSGSLPNRLYYYHSAAEMLFVSAILTGISVICVPLCVRYKAEIKPFSYGHGFFVGVVAALCYLASAGLINLDVFIMSTVPAKEIKRRSRH